MEEGSIKFAVIIEQQINFEYKKYSEYLKYEVDNEEDCLW